MALLVFAYHYSRTSRQDGFEQALQIPIQAPAPDSTPLPLDIPEISRIATSTKLAVFTFDGGSGDGSTREILTALAAHKIKGTFFFVGRWIEENPELTKQIIAEGHEIFNHSYSHPYFTQLTAEDIAKELKEMDDLLYSTVGLRTKPYYRPPYGDRNDAVNRAAAAAGYQSIYWSVDSLDWRDGETPESVKNRVFTYMHPGAIVLMHVGNPVTGQVIDEIFTTLENDGYKLVSLTEALSMQ
jgi:peptidoglycan/xylan/chitin deacetylase (PgdA/CDA1 family)